MALQGTHIKFAVDLMEKLNVQDEKRYIVGTVYPDSRYATGIAREKTHFDMLDPFQVEDAFRKGWSVHLLLDKLQADVFSEDFQDIMLNKADGEKAWWHRITAMKCIQDEYDVTQFDILPYLAHLTHVEKQFDEEDAAVLKSYQGTVMKMYGEARPVHELAYQHMLVHSGVSEEDAVAIVQDVQRLKQDSAVVKRISGIYDEVLKRFNTQQSM